MRHLTCLFLFITFISNAQDKVLILGNYGKLCDQFKHQCEVQDSVPENLAQYKTILLFSNAASQLTEKKIEKLLAYVHQGGGLYIGSENWPLQAESKQLTQKIYSKESYGDFYEKNALSAERGNLKLEEINSIPAGETTVAFPMDYRLTVEAWVEDQPLILSGYIEKGRIIIDGGYSRFYCQNSTIESEQLLEHFLTFLLNKRI